MSETAPDAKYVLVPTEATEEIETAMGLTLQQINSPNYCPIFPSEMKQTWEAALAARPAALVELREAEMAVFEAAKGSVRWLHPVRCDCDLCNALARRDRALAAVEKNTGAKG